MDWFFNKIEKEGVSIYKFSKETGIPKGALRPLFWLWGFFGRWRKSHIAHLQKPGPSLHLFNSGRAIAPLHVQQRASTDLQQN